MLELMDASSNYGTMKVIFFFGLWKHIQMGIKLWTGSVIREGLGIFDPETDFRFGRNRRDNFGFKIIRQNN